MTLEQLYNSPVHLKIIISVIIVVVGLVLNPIIRITLDKNLDKFLKKDDHSIFFKKLIRLIVGIIVLISIIAVWVKNPWAMIVGFLGVFAVGFVAVWSMLSNVLAGILIVMTKPFHVNDKITLIPDNITGTVSDYNFFFIEITDEEGATISIPNNMVFQKIIKKYK